VYALPRDQRLEIRSKRDTASSADDGIAKFARLTGGWDGGDVNIIFAEHFGVERAGERWWQIDLVTGATRPLTLDGAPLELGPYIEVDGRRYPARAGDHASGHAHTPPFAQPYEIEPGQAFVTRLRNAGFVRLDAAMPGPIVTEDVTIFVNRWVAVGDPAHEDLDVARDAWLEQDFVRAKEIVEKLIPHSYELFLACIKIEISMLREKTA
jgi:hypothetical protein